jgi:tight adherence protein C
MNFEMILLMGLMATFTLSLSAAGYLALKPRRAALDRLKRLPEEAARSTSESGDVGMAVASTPVDSKRLGFLRKKMLKTPMSMGEASQTQKLLHYAGHRSGSALAVYNTIRMVCMLSLPTVFFLGTMQIHMMPATRFFAVAILALAGMIMPKLVLKSMARARQHRLKLSLPDALDLLVVCVESGLGLDAAMRKVCEEMKEHARVICEELSLANFQLQMGRPRREVLHDLGVRTGVDDVRSLAAILIQADKFGSSVAQALRVQSDSMRTRRRQLAEEKAAKTAVKLIFPLVLFIFPGIFVVLVGPAAITMVRQMFPVMAGNK